jgi:hypothetical protein
MEIRDTNKNKDIAEIIIRLSIKILRNSNKMIINTKIKNNNKMIMKCR